VEALKLFEDTINSIYFLDANMILFLNKKDLFQEKIKRTNIKDIPEFADYTGAIGDFDAGVDYFVTKFLSKNKNDKRNIYYHITCATDTRNVQVVFNACKDIVLQQNIRRGPFSME
jgi:hypothetical protein